MRLLVISLWVLLWTAPFDWPTQSNIQSLNRQRIESLFVKRCPAIIPAEGWTCYQATSDVTATVKYESEDNVQQLSLSSCNGTLENLDQIATKIILVNARGKYIDRTEKDGPGCRHSYTMEYEYLTMTYSSTVCMNCTHPSLFIMWKATSEEMRRPNNTLDRSGGSASQVAYFIQRPTNRAARST